MPDPNIQSPGEFEADRQANGAKISPTELEIIEEARRGGEPEKARILERAARLGTLNKIDRRAQYKGPERASNTALLDSVNELGNHARDLRKDTNLIRKQVFNLRLRNAIVVAAITGVIARADAIVAWIGRLLK